MQGVMGDFSETVSGKVNPMNHPVFASAVEFAQKHGVAFGMLQ
jgi:hypothetical protein